MRKRGKIKGVWAIEENLGVDITQRFWRKTVDLERFERWTMTSEKTSGKLVVGDLKPWHP